MVQMAGLTEDYENLVDKSAVLFVVTQESRID